MPALSAKLQNVYKLPTREETAQRTEQVARAFMDAEHDINQLLCMADLALHIHMHELEGHPISEAYSPLQTILENVQALAKKVRQRFYEGAEQRN